MRRHIPWTDALVYGDLVLIAFGFSIWTALTPQDWNVVKIFVLVLTPVVSLAVALVVLLGRWTSWPSYMTRHGMAVWQAKVFGVSIPSQAYFEAALDHMVEHLPDLIQDFRVNRKSLLCIFRGSQCEFRDEPLATVSRYGWAVRDKAGFQQGRSIMVEWRGKFTDSAFYHELGHLIRQEVMHKSIDCKHEDVAWWKHIDEMRDKALGFVWDEGI